MRLQSQIESTLSSTSAPGSWSGSYQRPLRIAVLGMRGLPSAYSGIEVLGARLYPALAALGHDVTVYSRLGHGVPGESAYGGVAIQPSATIPWQSFETLSNVATGAVGVLRRSRPDVVHLHALAPALATIAFRPVGISTVVTVHGLDWSRAKWRGIGSRVLKTAERTAVKLADEIIVVSGDLQDYYWRHYGRATTLIRNPATPERIDPTETGTLLRAIGLDPEQPYFTYVGRLVPEKRVEDLIAAFRTLPAGLSLLISGDGPESYCRRLRLLAMPSPGIIFTGRRSHHDVQCLLGGARASILPSELEGFPMAALESLSLGTPVLLSDLPCHREMISGTADYDLLFPVAESRSIAALLSRVLSDPPRYAELGRRARSNVLTNFNMEQFVRRTESVLMRAAKRAPV